MPPHTPQFAPLPQCAAALREHPAVREALVGQMAAPNQPVVAFVLPDEGYLDDVLGRKEAASGQVRRWRKVYDLSQLAKPAAASPVAFNLAGWNSSYTRQPLPPEDMREWVQTTVDRIGALAPTEVLEIGCGAGLLLLRLAPACQRYVALDFSPQVLRKLREHLAQTADLFGKVDLLERSADNFEGFAEDSFSTVIVNSVAQYFPSLSYLDRVVENAIRVTRPGGHVFIGDLRNFVLHEAYAASVETFQATPEDTVGELRSRIQRRMQQEAELVVSPAYFLSLQHRFPKISRVEIYPRRGHCDNEMTRFRFDAIFWLGPESTPAAQIQFPDAPAGGWKLDDMKSRLTSGREAALGFACISNSRVAREIPLLTQLASAGPELTLGELRRYIDQPATPAVHPEEIAAMAAETGFRVAMSWAVCYSDGAYDAVFVRQGSGPKGDFPSVPCPQPSPAAFVYLANAPGQSGIRERLGRELLSTCSARLPGQPVPTRVCLVDAFPRRADRSVDCEALLSASQATLLGCSLS